MSSIINFPALKVLRYSALGLGLLYGYKHNGDLAVFVQQRKEALDKHKHDLLVEEARIAYHSAKSRAEAEEAAPIVVDPESYRFNQERWIAYSVGTPSDQKNVAFSYLPLLPSLLPAGRPLRRSPEWSESQHWKGSPRVANEGHAVVFLYASAALTSVLSSKLKSTAANVSSKLAQINRELESELRSHRNAPGISEPSVKSDVDKPLVAALPWDVVDPLIATEIKMQVFSLSKDPRNFTIPPSDGTMFTFNLASNLDLALQLLNLDEELQQRRFELVPQKVSELNFWRNYFYRLNLVCRLLAPAATGLTSPKPNLENIIFTKAPLFDAPISCFPSESRDGHIELKDLTYLSKPDDDADAPLSPNWEQELEEELNDV